MPTEPRTAPRRERVTPRGPIPAIPTAAVAAATLVAAFAVAQASDVRALGGALLVAGVAWCVWRSVHAAGWLRVVVVVLVGAVCFVGAHLLSPVVGPWPAVLLAALVLGVVAWVLTDTRS